MSVVALAALPLPALAQADDKPCPPRVYPLESAKAEEKGTTRVRVRLMADGTVAKAIVSRSSGHRRLDDAALEHVARCKFKPGKDGRTVEFQYKWP